MATSYRFATVEGSTQKPAPNGAKELSPALQRWVEWEIKPSPVGTAEVATQSLQPLRYAIEDHLMTKLEAVIQPSKFEAVKDALLEIGVEGMTVTEVRGHGRQKGHTEFYRGREYTVDLLPKVKIEAVMPDRLVDQAIAAVTNAARTGKIGDGKIFLSRVDEAIRIRNEERGEAAL